jgi:5-hydroxyisourate hydrolase
LPPGHYRGTFEVAAYFTTQGRDTFFPLVLVSFTVVEGEAHYHVPLLLSPYSHTTYRGS